MLLPGDGASHGAEADYYAKFDNLTKRFSSMENCNLEENGKICISRRYILDEFLDLSLKVP